MMTEQSFAKQELITQLGQLTVLEVLDLVQSLEKAWGVTAQATLTVVPPPPPPPTPEDTHVDLVLVSYGDQKIKVIKEIRMLLGLDLKGAKTLVDQAPYTVREHIEREEAETLKQQLEAVGATVEIR